MSRLLSRTPSHVPSHAAEGRYRGRHRADRPDRPHRAERPEPAERLGRLARAARPARPARRPGALRTAGARWRRRAPYAAASLLALTGALSHATPAAPTGPAVATAASAAPEPASYRIRPAAVRPALVTRPAARTRPATRARTVEVSGAVYRGRATWYGPGFAGRRTASGEVFRPHSELTAAHRWLPFGTRLRVCRRGRCVVVRVNDRGPFGDAILDLSQLAAERLGLIRAGIAPVTATVVETRVVRSAA
jgi:rare lipoprotein A